MARVGRPGPSHRRHRGLRLRRSACSPSGLREGVRPPRTGALRPSRRRGIRRAIEREWAWRVGHRRSARPRGCEQAPAPPRDGRARPLVVASFFTLCDFARHVAGDRAEVVVAVPPGVEPHDWEPSPRDVADARQARLFVYNGGGLEPMADRLLTEIAGKGPLVLNATDGLPLLGKDPHVWLDPRARAARRWTPSPPASRGPTPRVGPTYERNAAAYKARLATLHDTLDGRARELRPARRRDVPRRLRLSRPALPARAGAGDGHRPRVRAESRGPRPARPLRAGPEREGRLLRDAGEPPRRRDHRARGRRDARSC